MASQAYAHIGLPRHPAQSNLDNPNATGHARPSRPQEPPTHAAQNR